MIKLMLAGGGTGGHVYPLVAIGEYVLKNNRNEIEVRFIGDGKLMESEARALGVEFSSVLSSKWRRYFSFMNFVDILKFPIGVVQAFFKVWWYMPDVMFSKGGYASFLPSIMAWVLRVPLYIHESDTVPGKTNIFLGKFAKKIFTSFEMSEKYFPKDKVILVGLPLREGVIKIRDKIEALNSFGLDDSKPTVFITGASQGAEKINSTLILSLTSLIQDYHVIHQCGPKNHETVKRQVDEIIKEEKELSELITNNYHLYPALTAEQMSLAYSASDVVVSRSGSTIHEVAILGKPLILIPLPTSANNHQWFNAQELSKYGASVIEEHNFTHHILLNEINLAYQNRFDLSPKIKKFARPDAINSILKEIII